jgi:hypothetical protein
LPPMRLPGATRENATAIVPHHDQSVERGIAG